jgi:dihydrofolate reductase
VAKQMNELPKIVFSKSMDQADWTNTRLVKGDPVTEMRKLKQAPGKDMVIFGSGSIVSKLAEAGLIDEYQLIVVPIALGKGRTMFEGVSRQLTLKPTRTRSFRNGRVLLCYEPAAESEGGMKSGEARGRRREPAKSARG